MGEGELGPSAAEPGLDALEPVDAVHGAAVVGFRESLVVRQCPEAFDPERSRLLEYQGESERFRVEWAGQVPQRDRLGEQGPMEDVPEYDSRSGYEETSIQADDLPMGVERGVRLEVSELHLSPGRPSLF